MMVESAFGGVSGGSDVEYAEPKAGDEVYALGSPLTDQLAGTVTRGVLSSVRELEQRRWLQSDVSLPPGSSGGPLVGPDGAVIGISTKGTAGINLSCPSGTRWKR